MGSSVADDMLGTVYGMSGGPSSYSSQGPALTIVIPAHNEAERLGPTLAGIGAFLAHDRRAAEVVVVDDGSTDGTRACAERCLAEIGQPGRVVTGPSPGGKGAALRAGVLGSSGRRVLLTDADLSTPMSQLARLERAIDEGADIAIGSRDVPGSDVQVRQAVYREGMGRTFNLLIRAMGLTRFRDTQCGFKLFDGPTARRVFARVTIRHFACDVETLLIAERLGARIVEVPVVWRNHPRSTVHPVRDAGRMLWDVLRLRLGG